MATVQPVRVRSGRGVELGLLLLALAVGWAAYALVGLGTANRVPANALWYGVGMAAMALGMHVVLRWRAPYADPTRTRPGQPRPTCRPSSCRGTSRS